MYFDKDLALDADDQDDAVKEVGNPTRLAQLLTIFFPAYSMSSAIGRETLIACTKPLLAIVHQKMGVKVKGKGKKSVVWPIAKMVEYICHTVENGEDAANADTNGEEEEVEPNDASPVLKASIVICEFLNEEGEDLSTAYLRSLCKILSKSHIDSDSEDIKALRLLKRGLDELAMNITDITAMTALEKLMETVEDVESDDEDSAVHQSIESNADTNESMGMNENSENEEQESEDDNESNVSRDSKTDNDKSSIEVEMDGAANDSDAESEIESPDDVPDVKMNIEESDADESEEESDNEVVPASNLKRDHLEGPSRPNQTGCLRVMGFLSLPRSEIQ